MAAVVWADGFSAIYADHHAGALRLAYLLCGNREWAEDAVADAFAATYVQWRKGRVDDPGPYVRRAVVNRVRGGFRRRSTERRYAAGLRAAPAAAPASAPFEQGTIDRQALLAALGRLPDRQRAAVVLRYYGDLSEAGAAAALGCSVPALKTLSSRGVHRLRELLADGGEGR